MRVCILNEFFYPDETGGTGAVLSELARHLHDEHAQIEIDVITSTNLYRPKPGDKLAKRENWAGIEITRVKTPRPNGLPAPLRLLANTHFSLCALATLLPRHYDLVIVATAPPTASIVTQMYKALRGVPYLYIVYDLEPDRAVTMHLLPGASPIAGLLRTMQKNWLNHADQTIVLGRCMKAHVARSYGLPNNKISVIPVGADASEITPLSRETRFRRDNAIEGFTVLYSGNFGRYHDFDTVLNTAKQLQQRNAAVTFVLVGDGAQRKHIEQRIAGEQIANVRLFPFVDKSDYADLLASADVSLVTLEEGMEGICVPSKFYSILASGRPTIAVVPADSEVGYVIAESKCGLRVDHGDTGGLTAAIDALAADRRLCMELGNNARRALETEFSSEKVVEKYYQALLSVAHNRSTWSSFAKSRVIRWSRASSARLRVVEAERSVSAMPLGV